MKRTTEGQAVLDFYRMNTFLDIKNRKRVVNLVIKEVVERKVNKYTALFHDITRQLLELFPNEKYVCIFVNLSYILNFILIEIFNGNFSGNLFCGSLWISVGPWSFVLSLFKLYAAIA